MDRGLLITSGNCNWDAVRRCVNCVRRKMEKRLRGGVREGATLASWTSASEGCKKSDGKRN
ncbi:hypothetical protein X777_04585 [Ooceraea biroi]|uniref:Uncharacterized protein n=1 Tax=Ooceraea biroi TaxID=2015173 RepID=A0A026X4C0_OOCBI|nr:hypothetical protein X777_04585 [Ooceraea biroi]